MVSKIKISTEKKVFVENLKSILSAILNAIKTPKIYKELKKSFCPKNIAVISGRQERAVNFVLMFNLNHQC